MSTSFRPALRLPFTLRALPLAALPLTVLALAAPLPALADKEGGFDPLIAESCLDQGGWLECIGQAAEACSAPANLTEACSEAERRYWESRIDETLPAIEFRNEALDGADPRALPRHMGFEDFHTAFLEYRNRRCDYEGSLWGAGESDSANAACMMRVTGQHYLDLLSYAAEG